MNNDTPKPVESGPLDLAPIEARLNKYVRNPFFAPGPINEDAAALIVEVKRLRGNIGLLIQKWSFHSPHTRDTLKAKDVLTALQDALVSENYYAGEED
jgi:hypothetical protein